MSETKRKRTFPPHLGERRAFKARKRRELAALERAVDVVRMGCAYAPIYKEIDAVTRIVKDWRQVCSAKAWGR